MQQRVNKLKWLHRNGRRQVPFPENLEARATCRHTAAYARYIRQVVVDRKVCKIVTDMYVLSFINPILHGWQQSKLGRLKVKIIRAVDG